MPTLKKRHVHLYISLERRTSSASALSQRALDWFISPQDVDFRFMSNALNKLNRLSGTIVAYEATGCQRCEPACQTQRLFSIYTSSGRILFKLKMFSYWGELLTQKNLSQSRRKQSSLLRFLRSKILSFSTTNRQF